MAEKTVILKDVSKTFGKASVLKDISLELEAGKFYALLGRNGTGKSTLMRLLTRNELVDSGTGQVLEFPLDSDRNDFNEKICYVSESSEFPPFFRLSQWYPEYRKAFKNWDNEVFKHILDKLKINEEKYFQELSRGQKMQVMLACAIAQRPKLILLDEVTSVLDPNARSFLMKFLSDLVQGNSTLVMATNIASEVQSYAQNLIILDDHAIKLDLSLTEVSKFFLKLRKLRDSSHPIFLDSQCIEVSLNSDGSTSHMIPITHSKENSLPEEILDRRGITIEEIFIFHTRKEGWK